MSEQSEQCHGQAGKTKKIRVHIIAHETQHKMKAKKKQTSTKPSEKYKHPYIEALSPFELYSTKSSLPLLKAAEGVFGGRSSLQNAMGSSAVSS